MSKLKIVALIVIASSCSMEAIAHKLPPAKTAPIIVPVTNKWHLGVAGLYLRPNFGGNGLGYTSFSNYGTDFFNRHVEIDGAPNNLSNIVPNRAWGFMVDGSYDYCMGNDIDVAWYHLNENTSGHLPRGTLFAGSASGLYAGRLNVKTNWDEVDLQVGQRFDLDPMNMIRIRAGLQYSRIQVAFSNSPQLNPVGPPLFVTRDTITYNGVGPVISGDYTFTSCFGLGAYAKAAGSLLAGTARQSVSGYHDLGGFNLYSTGNYNQSNSNVIVPELKANLGLKYDFQLRQGTLGFDAGYMFVTYLGALVSQVGAGVVSSSISTSSSTNFNLNGPYFGVTWAGEIC